MKNILPLIILFLTLSITAQVKNCTEFKIGEFRYAKENMPEKIVRTESLQVETNPNSNTIIKTSIEWISACEYVLTYTEIINSPMDVSEIIGKKIYCEIIETNGNRLKVHAKSDSMDEVLEFIKID